MLPPIERGWTSDLGVGGRRWGRVTRPGLIEILCLAEGVADRADSVH